MNRFLKTLTAVSLVLACTSSAYCAGKAKQVTPGQATQFSIKNNTGQDIKVMVFPAAGGLGELKRKMSRVMGNISFNDSKANPYNMVPVAEGEVDRIRQSKEKNRREVDEHPYSGGVYTYEKYREKDIQEAEKNKGLIEYRDTKAITIEPMGYKKDKAGKLIQEPVNTVSIMGVLEYSDVRSPMCKNIPLDGAQKTITFEQTALDFKCIVKDPHASEGVETDFYIINNTGKPLPFAVMSSERTDIYPRDLEDMVGRIQPYVSPMKPYNPSERVPWVSVDPGTYTGEVDARGKNITTSVSSVNVKGGGSMCKGIPLDGHTKTLTFNQKKGRLGSTTTCDVAEGKPGEHEAEVKVRQASDEEVTLHGAHEDLGEPDPAMER